jgi:methylase of polypeptide subunit release factors
MTDRLGVTPTSVKFGGLTVPLHDNVLTPRPWTLAQSDWAVDLLDRAAPGPILELFAGSGHIGIEAARRTGRKVVLVDTSPDACRLAEHLAAAHDVDADVVCTSVDADRIQQIQPALIMADPPYVPTGDVAEFPDDPPGAIDGGPDGLGPARTALLAVQRMAGTGVPVVIQLRGLHQATAIEDWLRDHRTGVAVSEVRCVADDQALALLRRRPS